MGPQHPATHGVLRLLLQTDGEIVYKVTPVVGYLHRCAEKIAEGVDYKQWIVYTDRFDYLAPVTNNHTYVTAVEKLAGLEVPERAEHLRVVTAELSRIASHLIALATFGLDMGAWTPLLYSSPWPPSAWTWGPGRRCCTASASGRRSSTCSSASPAAACSTTTWFRAACATTCRGTTGRATSWTSSR
jgi:hypothetical protein